MRKWGYAGVGVIVAALVLAGPVLAAIVWEWDLSDSCVWTGTGSCQEYGLQIDSEMRTYPDIAAFEDGTLYLETDDGTLQVRVLDAGGSVVYSTGIDYISEGGEYYGDLFSADIPQFLIGYGVSIYHSGWGAIVSYIAIDAPTPTPSPTPTPAPVSDGRLLDDFSVTGIFATASELIGAMMAVAVLISGILLGFKALSWLVARIR